MDNNEYISKQKVEKWTTKEKFNALDPRTIEPGTEYNLTGAIEEGELDAALQSKINGKLTAPTTPTAESAVVLGTDGTVGTKPLSEIGGGGGGKLYRHKIALTANTIVSNLNFYVYNRNNAKLTLNDIAGEYFLASITGGVYSGVVSCIVQPSTDELATYKLITEGVVINPDNAAFALKDETQDYDISINDAWAEL